MCRKDKVSMRKEEEKETKNSLDLVDDLLSDLEQQPFVAVDATQDFSEAEDEPFRVEASIASVDDSMTMQLESSEEVISDEITEAFTQDTVVLEPAGENTQMKLPNIEVNEVFDFDAQQDDVRLEAEPEEPAQDTDGEAMDNEPQMTFSETMPFIMVDEDASREELMSEKKRSSKTHKDRQREQTRMRRAGKQKGIPDDAAYISAALDLRTTCIFAAISLALLLLGFALQQSAAGVVALVLSYVTIAVPQIVVCIRTFLKSRSITQGIMVLIATAIVFLLSYRTEAVITMMLYTAGTILIEYLIARAPLAAPEEKGLLPKYACQVDMQGAEDQIDIRHVRRDALYFVRDGEIIPADAIVIRGEGEITRDVLEMDSISYVIAKDDEVLAGDRFRGQALLICATQDFDTCAFQKINAMRTNATNKASIEESVLSNPGKYMALLAVLAVVITFLPPLFKFDTISVWLYRALIVIAIGYPSALLLSVPIGFRLTSRNMQKNGIITRGNGVIEKAANLRMMIFDKTGVLTDAVFRVKEVHTIDGFRQEDCIALAATAEQHSTHPVARSIVAAYGKEPPSVKDFSEIPGQGVIARVQGNALYVGNRSLMVSKGVKNVPDFQGTVLYVAYERKYIGAVILEDTVREEAKQVLSELKGQGILKTVLLTGDAERSAEKAAEECGIESFHASLVPEEKAAKVEFLLRTVPVDGSTAYVGDGIYDKKELKIADVGITMKPHNAEMISETTDALILSHDLKKLNYFVGVAKKAHSVNVQNTLLTIAIKMILVLLAAFGVIGLWQSLLIDMLVSIVLVLNSLKLSK